MKALEYLDELIDFEESYLEGFDDSGEKRPIDHVKRLKDLKKAKEEIISLVEKVKKLENI